MTAPLYQFSSVGTTYGIPQAYVRLAGDDQVIGLSLSQFRARFGVSARQCHHGDVLVLKVRP